MTTITTYCAVLRARLSTCTTDAAVSDAISKSGALNAMDCMTPDEREAVRLVMVEARARVADAA